jgi:hypothetical protein
LKGFPEFMINLVRRFTAFLAVAIALASVAAETRAAARFVARSPAAETRDTAPSSSKAAVGAGWLSGFGLANGCNGAVEAFAYDEESNAVYVGGRFSTCGDVGANNVARFDLATRTWSALHGAKGGDGVRGTVHALLVVGNEVYVGGNFDAANVGAPVVATMIARWDGIDWHALSGTGGGEGTDSFVYALAWRQGSIYVGGAFTSVETGAALPVAARSLARWNGIAWSAPISPDQGSIGVVRSLLFHKDAPHLSGELSDVLRLDGSVLTPVGTGLPYSPANRAPLAVFDGRLVVASQGVWSLENDEWIELAVQGEWEGTVGGALVEHQEQLIAGAGILRRFDASSATWVESRGPALWTGATWQPLDLGLSAMLEEPSEGMWIASCGSVLCAAGAFGSLPSAPAAGIHPPVAWRPGEIERFGPGRGNGADGRIAAVLVDGDQVYVGGDFTHIGGISANGIARWDGRRWRALGNAHGDGMRARVTALAMYQGQLHAAGVLRRPGIATATGEPLLRWDGTSWSAVGQPPLTPGLPSIRAMREWRGELYIGGVFANSPSDPFSTVALLRWNGTRWSEPANGGRFSGRVNALDVMNDELYVAGIVTGLSAGGSSSSANRIARWDGIAWHPLASATGEGVNQEIYSLLVDGGDLYVGGAFTQANVGNPIPTPSLARWDGVDWYAVGTGQPAMLGIRTMARAGDALYFGAARATAGTNADRAILARWDGNAWSTQGLEVSGRVVNAITAYPRIEGLVIGGEFGSVTDVTASNIAMFGIDDRGFVDGFESYDDGIPLR